MSKSEPTDKSKKSELVPAKDPKSLKTVTAVLEQHHSGPLPTAKEFNGYEQTLPGAAERILFMAEKEQNNRHQLQHLQQEDNTKVINKGFFNERLGMILTSVIVLLILGVALLLILAGHVFIGSLFGGFDIIGFSVAQFGAARRRKREKEKPGEKKDG